MIPHVRDANVEFLLQLMNFQVDFPYAAVFDTNQGI